MLRYSTFAHPKEEDSTTTSTMTSEDDLIDKVLLGYAALLSHMTRFYETDLSSMTKQCTVREQSFNLADHCDEFYLALELTSFISTDEDVFTYLFLTAIPYPVF